MCGSSRGLIVILLSLFTAHRPNKKERPVEIQAEIVPSALQDPEYADVPAQEQELPP